MVATADSLQGFRDAVSTVDEIVLRDHAGRGDFSRWVRDVFANHGLSRQLAKVERRYRAADAPHLRAAIDRVIVTGIRACPSEACA